MATAKEFLIQFINTHNGVDSFKQTLVLIPEIWYLTMNSGYKNLLFYFHSEFNVKGISYIIC